MSRYANFSLAVLAVALLSSVSAFAQESQAEAEAPVSRARAQKIALDSVVGGKVVESDFHNRWFKDDDYSFIVVNATDRYDIYVDAKTGKIISTTRTPVFQDRLPVEYKEVAAPTIAAGTLAEKSVSSAADRALSSTHAAVDRAVDAVEDAAHRILTPTRATAEHDGDAVGSVAARGVSTLVDTGFGLTPERVRTIASDRAPDAAIVEIVRKLDGEDSVYDVEMMGPAMQINMRIDGTDGKILSYDETLLERKECIN